MDDLRVFIIAGPNGAGKTTFAQQYLPNEAACPEFVNADQIAALLNPDQPEAVAIRAARVMLQIIDGHVAARKSFALETTLAGKVYLRKISAWQTAGYSVELVFLKLATVEEAVERVRYRVSQGGHDIPEQVVRRRFSAGLHNFNTFYKQAVNSWVLYDNSSIQPVLLEWGER